MTLLLDNPRLTPLLALLCAVLAGMHPKIYDVLLPIYESMESILAGTMFSLLGFVIAGLSIVISLQSSGLVKYLSEQKPGLWKQLLAVFSNTAKILTVAAFSLLIVNGLDFTVKSFYLTKFVYVVVFTFGLALVIMQIAKIIYILETIAAQSLGKPR